ncbi:HpcH/HpaI aldolase/citrate lyase family protein [Anaeromicropila populeti]|uniref:Citrate lyase beta subunit n=1 Tax=Anaeromicropila populeti TaxID=37658 RepID=A0A1I6IF27_9FIRM|nr:HpcH/HpaI aldolase/citrate lyase family protein [Anaeromicropila populeti]SFR65296.1 Citrate lyase beta subunit [Anaeromicropila populeti]
MKDTILYYSVGALLYCPANNETVVKFILDQKFGCNYSLAFCLEDTIQDDCVLDAENKLINTLEQINNNRNIYSFYLPKIFIRVRTAEQMLHLSERLKSCSSIITGFIIPKFSLENADSYIQNLMKINERFSKPVYAMPIYESASIVDLRSRYEILYKLKDKLEAIQELVLNIRVGGNDLCHLFGFRRHNHESIHQIKPISNIFSDIITVYGMEYVISGPVWEYYNGTNWQQGLEKELEDDKLCGFIGKTVIHPNQIEVVNESYKVDVQDLADAKAILNWDQTSNSLVAGNITRERMNEYKTHTNWAFQTIMLANVFGTKL